MARRSRFIGAGAIAFATGMLIALPAFSSGATVRNDLRSFDAAKPRVVHDSATPRTEPPLHGTNPHAQATAAVVDLTPNVRRPFSVDTGGTASDEDIVIGRARAERRANGDYHGHITAAALFGNEIIELADTGPGEPVEAGSLAAGVLTPLCTATGICLGALEYRSETTTTGSFNSFRTLSASLGGAVQLPGVPGLPGVVPPTLSIGAARSVANISNTGTCQTASGSSSVANVATANAPVVGLAESSSDSIACSGAGSSQTNSSRVVDLNGNPVPLLGANCANGVADTQVDLLAGLLPIVCNAHDASTSGGTQADNPAHVYGVRNALDVYVLAVGPAALAQVSAGQSESLAVAPAAAGTPTTTTTTTTTTPAAATTTTPATTTPAITPASGTDDDDGGNAGDDESGNEGAGDDGTGAGAGDGTPECSDGVDNDGDGKIDFGSDPGCSSAGDDSEADNVSLGGNELPFTGTDVVVLGLAGSLLLAAGLTLRGPARRHELDA